MPREDLMILSWDSYSTHLETMLVGMMTTSDYTNETLVCGGDQVQFKAHKVVLSASSPVMRNILQSYNTENPLIYLRGVGHEDMEAILQFIYLGEATVKPGRTEEFLKLANDFEIKTCLSMDQESLETRTESSCNEQYAGRNLFLERFHREPFMLDCSIRSFNRY